MKKFFTRKRVVVIGIVAAFVAVFAAVGLGVEVDTGRCRGRSVVGRRPVRAVVLGDGRLAFRPERARVVDEQRRVSLE